MRQDISGIALCILDDSNKGANHYRKTDKVQRIEVLLPRHFGLDGYRVLVHAFMEEYCHKDEDSKTNDLDDESCKDDVFAECLVVVTAAGEDSSSFVLSAAHSLSVED